MWLDGADGLVFGSGRGGYFDSRGCKYNVCICCIWMREGAGLCFSFFSVLLRERVVWPVKKVYGSMGAGSRLGGGRKVLTNLRSERRVEERDLVRVARSIGDHKGAWRYVPLYEYYIPKSSIRSMS